MASAERRVPSRMVLMALLRVENQWHRSGDQAHVARVEVEELVQRARVTAAAALLGELPDPHSGGVEQLLDDAVDRLGDLVTLGRVEVREAPREPGEFGGDDVLGAPTQGTHRGGDRPALRIVRYSATSAVTRSVAACTCG